jgi:hypothetical protein
MNIMRSSILLSYLHVSVCLAAAIIRPSIFISNESVPLDSDIPQLAAGGDECKKSRLRCKSLVSLLPSVQLTTHTIPTRAYQGNIPNSLTWQTGQDFQRLQCWRTLDLHV